MKNVKIKKVHEFFLWQRWATIHVYSANEQTSEIFHHPSVTSLDGFVGNLWLC